MHLARYLRTAAVLGSLVVATSVVAVPNAHAAKPKCFGERATHVGTKGNDTIVGTSGRDVIVARNGDDTIRGRGGGDLICAGRGSDLVLAGKGGDKVKGGRGFDIIDGQRGHDELRSGPASDEVSGGPGHDDIFLGSGFFQFALGGGGDDMIQGSPFPDCVGYFDANGPVDVNLDQGIATGRGTDTLIDIDCAEGSDFNDTITGNSSGNFLFGGGGDDTINTGGNGGNVVSPSVVDNFLFDFAGGDGFSDLPPGNDTITGGPGLNVVSYESSVGPVTVDFATGTATGEGTDVITAMNGVVGSANDDTFIGSEDTELFDGLSGDNDIDGAGGDDVLVLFDYRNAVVDLADGSYTADLLTFEDDPPTVPASGSLTSIENVWGSQFADQITGDEDDNDIFGEGGADTLVGLDGDDLLDGGGGVNTYDGGDGNDTCLGEGDKTGCETTDTIARARRSGVAAAYKALVWRFARIR